MSKTLYDKATHRDGALLWSGRDKRPAKIEKLKKDMDLELGRALQLRGCVLEPAKMGELSDFRRGGVWGNGWRAGSATFDHIGFDGWGTTKAGAYKIQNGGILAINQSCLVMGPATFEAHATKDLKFYFKGSIGDVTQTDVLIGMFHDDYASSSNWPHLHVLSSGTFTGTDGIGFERLAGAAGTDMSFSVWDADGRTNSTETVTFPATIDDDTEFECGFHVYGVDSVKVFMKVGSVETVTRFVKSATVLNLLTASLMRLAPAVGLRVGSPATDTPGPSQESITIQSLACTQPR